MRRIQRKGPGIFGGEGMAVNEQRRGSESTATPPKLPAPPQAATPSVTAAPSPAALSAVASPAHQDRGTSEGTASPGRAEPEETIRVTIYATADQIQQLDEDRWRIRRARRGAMERTGLIRGILEGYRRAGIDLVAAGVANEEDLARLIAGLLRGERA